MYTVDEQISSRSRKLVPENFKRSSLIIHKTPRTYPMHAHSHARIRTFTARKCSESPATPARPFCQLRARREATRRCELTRRGRARVHITRPLLESGERERERELIARSFGRVASCVPFIGLGRCARRVSPSQYSPLQLITFLCTSSACSTN